MTHQEPNSKPEDATLTEDVVGVDVPRLVGILCFVVLLSGCEEQHEDQWSMDKAIFIKAVRWGHTMAKAGMSEKQVMIEAGKTWDASHREK